MEQPETKLLDGLPVSGYTPQSVTNISAVNHNKQLEERVLRYFDYLGTLDFVDKRWLAIGRTDLEKAFMAANRAIFKPTRVRLEGDLPQQ